MRKADAEERAKKVTTVVFDVDGVLTDGGIYIDSHGEEIKRFNVQDGAGIKYLQRGGFRVAIISGRESRSVAARAEELGIVDLYQGHKEKIKAFDDLLTVHALSPENVAYMGDDLPDLPVMRVAGLAAAVANARYEVKAIAHYVSDVAGGQGAAREFAEWLLMATGKWDGIMSRYSGR